MEMSANVSINENTFKLSNVTVMDRINITIRAVGSAGVGIPIYVNLPGEKATKEVDDKESTTKAKYLGILIGVLLSLVIVFIFAVVFIKFRSCTKNRQNGVNHNANMAYDQSMHPCSRDNHEMQTLIPQMGLTTTTFVSTPNGNAKHGILDSFTESESRRENGGQIALNSSPRVSRGAKGRSDGEEESSRDVSDESENTLRMDECTASKEGSPVSKKNINGNGNMIRMNGSVKTLNFTPPQHSTTILPPNQQTPINNNVQCNGRNLHDASVDSIDFDDSQQQLLGHSTPKSAKNTPNHVTHDRCNDIKYHNGSSEILSPNHNGITKCDDTYNWIVNNVGSGKSHQNNDHTYRRPIVGPNG
uniref:Uncharacterized protein n=3 Tax=Lutzomyia longipalpis TaxID=7200 RepID=A0A1B0GKU8_LUTLO